MSFAELGGLRGATIPEHGRLRGLEVGNPHPQYALAADVSQYPLGELGYAQVIANQGAITTVTDLTGLSVDVTVAAGRTIRVTGTARASNTGANSNVLYIYEDGVAVQTSSYVASTATEGFPPCVARLTPSEGTHTYKLVADVGAGTMTLRAASTNPAFILVEDLGAA